MDNQPDNEINETSDNQAVPETPQIDTMSFDLNILSNKIQESVVQNKDETKYDESSENNQLDPFMSSQETEKPVPLPEVHVETSVKKYVIHVDPENVNYMEHLTINERRVVINKILKDQSIYTKEELKKAKNKKRVMHTLVVVITFAVFLPLFFIAITTAAKLTFDTYAASKSNFSKLYRENGVIKRQR